MNKVAAGGDVSGSGQGCTSPNFFSDGIANVPFAVSVLGFETGEQFVGGIAAAFFFDELYGLDIDGGPDIDFPHFGELTGDQDRHAAAPLFHFDRRGHRKFSS
jgi:hypothetical protein